MPEVALTSNFDRQIKQAVDCLLNGGIVAFPTETYYGLAVDPRNENSVRRLYELKKRDFTKPLLLLVENEKQLLQVVDRIPDAYKTIMDEYWPGALTLIFPASKSLCKLITGGTDTVGVRISPNQIARRLICDAGFPITATSANISEQPAAINAGQIREIFGNFVDYIVDGGPVPGGEPSTIVGMDGGTLKILREGVVKIPLCD